jgi:hypothetical protein
MKRSIPKHEDFIHPSSAEALRVAFLALHTQDEATNIGEKQLQGEGEKNSSQTKFDLEVATRVIPTEKKSSISKRRKKCFENGEIMSRGGGRGVAVP